MVSRITVAVMLSPGWLDFLVMTGAFLLVAIGGLFWILFIRKTRQRRRKHHHHHHLHPASCTLSPPDRQPPDGQEGSTFASSPTPRT